MLSLELETTKKIPRDAADSLKVNCASWFSCGCCHRNFTTTAKWLMEHDINHSQWAAPILSKSQSNQESMRLSGTGRAVEAAQLHKPWSTLLGGCHCCFSAAGSWDLSWKVCTFYVCLHGFPWEALVSPPIKNMLYSPVTVLLTTVLAYSCSWSPGFAVLKSQDGLNAGNEFPYWDQ